MVEDRNVWKNGEWTLVLWTNRRVKRLKENSMWSWLRSKFQIWFWQIVISACRIILTGGTWKITVTKDKWLKVVAERQTKIKNDCRLRIMRPYVKFMTDNLDLTRGIANYHVHLDCQLPCPPRLPATMSTSTLTVIMPPNTNVQLNRGRALLTSSTSLLSWKTWFHDFHTVARVLMMEWWA